MHSDCERKKKGLPPQQLSQNALVGGATDKTNKDTKNPMEARIEKSTEAVQP